MGNLQYLAQKVLSKYCHDTKVSCFTPLAKETGNPQGKSGNTAGNFERIPYEKSQRISSFKEEISKETSRKPVSIDKETFAANITNKSFLMHSATDMLDGFISNAVGLNIDLLPDDQRWLRAVCFGINRPTLACYLSEYIDRWHNAMREETATYRKQNAGRKAANTWLLKTLTNQNTSWR
ncbi:MAG: hypothetical protein SFW66_09830 [Gammaproteobacteria bacterium]|nr:hypothetical protein [Gammaproteobacteria bacterium]